MGFVFQVISVCVLSTVFANYPETIVKRGADNDRHNYASKREVGISYCAFSFYLITHDPFELDGDVIVFQGELLNAGNCYSDSKGSFTAPVTGTYIFSFKLMFLPDVGGFKASLMVNHEYAITTLLSYAMEEGIQAGTSAIANLNKNDQVFLEGVGFVFGTVNYPCSTFSGYLLFKTYLDTLV